MIARIFSSMPWWGWALLTLGVLAGGCLLCVLLAVRWAVMDTELWDGGIARDPVDSDGSLFGADDRSPL